MKRSQQRHKARRKLKRARLEAGWSRFFARARELAIAEIPL
jgi:hypothetical protein